MPSTPGIRISSPGFSIIYHDDPLFVAGYYNLSRSAISWIGYWFKLYNENVHVELLTDGSFVTCMEDLVSFYAKR